MNLYEKVFEEIEEKKERKEKGLFNGIPLCYEKYQEYVSSIDKGIYYGVVAAPGEGKSRWARYTFIYEPLKFSLKNDYPIKILYFALEDGKTKVYKKIMAHYFWENHGIDVSSKYLESKNKPLPDKYINLLKQDVSFYNKFEENVFIIDNKFTPTEILTTCEEFYKKYGSSNHLIVIIDNYANIQKDKEHYSQHEAIGYLSKQVRNRLCEKLKMSVLAVVQQDMETMKNTARNAGTGRISSIEPTLGSFGINKEIARD